MICCCNTKDDFYSLKVIFVNNLLLTIVNDKFLLLEGVSHKQEYV